MVTRVTEHMKILINDHIFFLWWNKRDHVQQRVHNQKLMDSEETTRKFWPPIVVFIPLFSFFAQIQIFRMDKRFK